MPSRLVCFSPLRSLAAQAPPPLPLHRLSRRLLSTSLPLRTVSSPFPPPLRQLAPDESVQVPSATSSSTYTCKRVDDHYTCQCPAWKIQKGRGLDARTCKHLRQLLGDPYEDARLAAKGFALPAPTAKPAKKRAAPVTKAPAKAKKGTKEEDEVDDPSPPVVKEKRVVEVLLAKKFEIGGKLSPEGWWMSEKLDGIRAYWDGEGVLWSRLGNQFYAPKWFTDKLPQGHTLDGELFHSRNKFSAATSIVRSHASEKWGELRYQVFDIPSLAHLPFEARLAHLHTLFPGSAVLAGPGSARPVPSSSLLPASDAPSSVLPAPDGPASANGQAKKVRSDHAWDKGSIVELVEQKKCDGLAHLIECLKEVEAGGGEGLMLREPGSLYVNKRSGTLLKVKTFFDAEAKVVGYEPGKGKYVGMTGSLVCEMESGKRFSCGSGLNDEQRGDPPKIGAIISYRFQEITKDQVPRFPTFVGERVDMLVAKDADVGSKAAKKKDGEEEE